MLGKVSFILTSLLLLLPLLLLLLITRVPDARSTVATPTTAILLALLATL